MQILAIFIFLLALAKDKPGLLQKFPKFGVQFSLPNHNWKKLQMEPQWIQKEIGFEEYMRVPLLDTADHEMFVRCMIRIETIKQGTTVVAFAESQSKTESKPHKINRMLLAGFSKDSAVIHELVSQSGTGNTRELFHDMTAYIVNGKTGVKFRFQTREPVWNEIRPEFEQILNSIRKLSSPKMKKK